MNIETLNRYHEDGLLYKQTHPNLPLTIWNYTEKVQYEGLWDEVTVQCRGLITEDTTGTILVRPFKKFFNYEEVVGKGVIPSQGDYVYIQEKMDGSLGILFSYEDEWIMATRGSFASEQAIKGLEIVKSKYFLGSWSKEYAYLVEIIYPENRIVVNYGEEKIVFLSVVLNESWTLKPTDDTELHWTTAKMILKANGVEEDDLVKTEQHFNFSDEFYNKIKEYEQELSFQFNMIFSDYFVHFRSIQNKIGDVAGNRAEFASHAKNYQYPSILFAILDGKDIAPIISKIIKPEFRKL